jgi:metal-sulfur cluster biosynthetic enzyme
MSDTPAPIDEQTREEIVQRVIEALRDVYDPELAMDVVAMGLVYDVLVDRAGDVQVDMTLTTPGCPVAESLPEDAATAVRATLGDHEVDVEVVWDPPWNPDRMLEPGADWVRTPPEGPAETGVSLPRC